jgi:O-antigen/teichoic acid export membrane protein
LKDEFIRHTGLMFIGIGLFNLLNFLYHFFMIRLLHPVDYGHLNSLIALFMVISVPASTVQTTVTKFISSFQVQNRYDRMKKLLRHLLILMSIIALLIFSLIALGSSFLSSFLQISSYGLIMLLGVVLFFAMVVPIPWGGLQGLQKFGSLTFNLIINGGLKFSLGILFVFLGFGVFGAMGAIAVSYIATTFLSFFMLGIYLYRTKEKAHRQQTSEEPEPSFMTEVYRYFLPVGITLLCFMILTNVDLILVKHFFTPIEAGYYSIAQMVGKVILFLPMPVLTVMFPKLTSYQGQEERRLSVLKKSLLIAAVLCGVAVLLVLFFPSLIIRILTGKTYPECIPLIRLFCINMTFYSLVLILLYYHLSSQWREFVYPLFFLTLAQIGLIILFHKTLIQLLWVVGVVAFTLFGVNLYFIYRRRERKRQGL